MVFFVKIFFEELCGFKKQCIRQLLVCLEIYLNLLSLHIILFLIFKRISVPDNATGIPNVVLQQRYLD